MARIGSSIGAGILQQQENIQLLLELTKGNLKWVLQTKIPS